MAERAGTSHSAISRIESGTHAPTLSVLARIFAVFDERLLIGVERDVPDADPEREAGPAPAPLPA